MSIDIEVADVKVSGTDDTEISTKGTIELSPSVVQPCLTNDQQLVEGTKKEYSIVGDGLYASVNAEDAPEWLTGIIDNVIDGQLSGSLSDLNTANQSIIDAINEVEIAKNEYQELINIDSTIDSVIASRLATLNATVDSNAASILNLDTTKVTEDEAAAIATQQISAELNNGSIRSEVNRIDLAVSDTNSSLASTTNTLMSSFEDLSSDQTANTTATNNLYTYTGINPDGTTTGTGLLATAAELTDLEAEVSTGTNTWASADSTLENSLQTYTDNEVTSVESKFAYNSVLNLNGSYYESGFGLTSLGTTGSGTELDPYNSEFWINAEKFKFTNDAQSGSTAPFTIDASGTTPQVTFNGVVSFNNVTNSENILQSGDAADDINSNTTTIDGGKITTNSLVAYNGLFGTLTSGLINGAEVIGTNITGSHITGATITGSVIKSSWLDFTTSGLLTNWQFFTLATVPAEYADNFAKNTDGTLVVDDMGYVRLPTTGEASSGSLALGTYLNFGFDQGSAGTVTYYPFDNYSLSLPAYDTYISSDAGRFLAANDSAYVNQGTVIDFTTKLQEVNDVCRLQATLVYGDDTYTIYVNLDESYPDFSITLNEAVVYSNYNVAYLTHTYSTDYLDFIMTAGETRDHYFQDEYINSYYVYTARLVVNQKEGGSFNVSNFTSASGPLFQIKDVSVLRVDNDHSVNLKVGAPGIHYSKSLLR